MSMNTGVTIPIPPSLQVDSVDSNSADSNCTVDNLTVLENKCQEVVRLPMMIAEAYNKTVALIRLGPRFNECDWLKERNLCSESIVIAADIKECIC